MTILEAINRFIWGIPLLVMILGIGVYLTVKTKGIQLRLLTHAAKYFFTGANDKDKKKQRQAFFTALAATVGTGNLAGVAGAIAIGGPGAVFWMWLCGITGMVIKFSEATLAVRYQHTNEAKETLGGPMYMIQRGLPGSVHWLAYVYSFLGVIAAFGVGNATQINAAVGSINTALVMFGVTPNVWINLLLGLLFAILILSAFWDGGVKIGKIAEILVPFASITYLVFGFIVLIINRGQILTALYKIVYGAYKPAAVTGGFIGSIFPAIRIGASRGVFTNEAGMGTAAIAHGSARTNHPVQQGLLGIIEVFVDTIVICTMTALVILCSGVTIPYGTDPGIQLTSSAFSNVLGNWFPPILACMVCCFAVATVFGWGLYGGRCAQFLFGTDCWKRFILIQAAVAMISAIMQTGTVWIVSEILNGLMAIPNLCALYFLSPELMKLTKDYCKNLKKSRHLE